MRRRILALGAAGALGVSGAVAWALPSVAQPFSGSAAVRMKADAPPPVPRDAVRLGALAAGTTLHLDVMLRVREAAALSAFVGSVTTRNSAQFGQFLRPGQFGPKFGATLPSIQAVRAALRQAGLAPGRVPANRLFIPVTASAGAVERAFGVALVRYRLAGGRIAVTNSRAPKIPGCAAT